jgi:hypothetical protein
VTEMMTVELFIDGALEVETTDATVVEIGMVGPAGPQGPPGVGTSIEVLDEGVSQGLVTDVNIVGAGATATVVGSVATITIPGGGGGGSDYHYVHNQAVAADVWVITHNLGKHPGGVTVYDSDGTEWEAVVVRITDNQLEVRLANAMSGVAYLS